MTHADHPAEITFLASRFWPDRHGGVEQRLWQVTRTFARRGWAVRVITENRTDSPAEETIEPGLTVRRIDRHDPKMLWRWPHVPRAWWWRSAIRSAKPTGIIWATDPLQASAAIAAGCARRLVYNPACCAAASALIHARHPHVTTFETPLAVRAADHLAWRNAGAVVVGARALRDQFIRHNGSRDDVSVVSHGVDGSHGPGIDPDAARRRFGLSPRDHVVGFVGRLDPCKDLPFLFHAMAGVGSRRIRLLIVGDGPDRQRLHDVASRLGIKDRIVWTGALDDPRPAYAAMNLFVLPSLYEAFGNVILEAMGAGVPVVGRRAAVDAQRPVLTANDELIAPGRTGLLCDPHDAGDLAAVLCDYLHRPAALKRMRQAAVDTARRLTWSRTVAGYERVLARVFDPRSATTAPSRTAA